jgi:hypothetical protein
MARDRNGRRADRRAFLPGLDGQLEARLLLAARPLGPNQVAVRLHPSWGPAWVTGHSGQVGVQTARGGRSVNLTTPDGQLYRVDATQEAIVRAVPTADGRVDLIVTGSRYDSQLLINRKPHPYFATGAHDFPHASTTASNVLRVRNIIVRTGAIRSILGFGTVELSGKIQVRDPANPSLTIPVDRIAVYSMRPGARIDVAGTVGTLDVKDSVELTGANDGIYVGQDLNWLDIGGQLNLSNGASVKVGRDLGAAAEPPKGTDTGGQGGSIFGNLNLSNGSAFTVGRNFTTAVVVKGNFIRNGATVVVGPFAFNTNVFAP